MSRSRGSKSRRSRSRTPRPTPRPASAGGSCSLEELTAGLRRMLVQANGGAPLSRRAEQLVVEHAVRVHRGDGFRDGHVVTDFPVAGKTLTIASAPLPWARPRGASAPSERC
jgi:hypothetical protein